MQLQYRLGPFGFLGGQATKDFGVLNAGLLDQVSGPFSVFSALLDLPERRLLPSIRRNDVELMTFSLRSNSASNGSRSTSPSSAATRRTLRSGENRPALDPS